MTFTWFCFFRHGDPNRRLSEADYRRLNETLGGCTLLQKAYVHTPSAAPHPYAGESNPPMLALELEFATLSACENSLCDNAELLKVLDPKSLESLANADATQQGMLGRTFPVADPDGGTGSNNCSYLVEYPGPAEDNQAWLLHYVTSHAAIMGKLPGIRIVAVYTPSVVASRFPFRFATAMLRNKVVFDSTQALGEALSSPVRDELRADVGAFPPYSGGSSHDPMDTTVVPGASDGGR